MKIFTAILTFIILIHFYSCATGVEETVQEQTSFKKTIGKVNGNGFFIGSAGSLNFVLYSKSYSQWHVTEENPYGKRIYYPLCEGQKSPIVKDIARYEVHGSLIKNSRNTCIQIEYSSPQCEIYIDYEIDTKNDAVVNAEWVLVGIKVNNEIESTPCSTRRIPFLYIYLDDSTPDSIYTVHGGATGGPSAFFIPSYETLFSEKGDFKGQFGLNFGGDNDFDRLFVSILNASTKYSINHNIMTITDSLNDREIVLQKGLDIDF